MVVSLLSIINYRLYFSIPLEDAIIYVSVINAQHIQKYPDIRLILCKMFISFDMFQKYYDLILIFGFEIGAFGKILKYFIPLHAKKLLKIQTEYFLCFNLTVLWSVRKSYNLLLLF